MIIKIKDFEVSVRNEKVKGMYEIAVYLDNTLVYQERFIIDVMEKIMDLEKDILEHCYEAI